MAIIKSANSDRRPLLGVVAFDASQENVVARYERLLAGDASLYTSKSGDVQIVSDPHTHVFNPVTTAGDMVERALGSQMSSLSSVSHATAHLGMCADGCNSYVLASSAELLRFCPVCASVVDPMDDMDDSDDSLMDDPIDPEYAQDLADDLDDLEFDDSYPSESGDDVQECEGDECEPAQDEEAQPVAQAQPAKVQPKAAQPAPAQPAKVQPKAVQPAKVQPAQDQPVDVQPEARVISVASSRQHAIKTFVRALTEQESACYKSLNSGAEFYGAGDVKIQFDPSCADIALRAKKDLASISSVLDSVRADKVESNYVVCSSQSCGSHIVSNFATEFCPSCASSVQEPEMAQEFEDFDDDDGDLDLNVSFDDEEFDEAQPQALQPERAISNVLSLVAGGGDLNVNKLDVSFCESVSGESAWLAFYDGQPVAKATASTASKHGAIFENPTFANAVYCGAKELGISKILVDMGFQPTMTSVSISSNLREKIFNKAFNEKVEAVARDAAREMESRNEEFQQRFVAALSTAAMGINRGFFKGYTNPMKASLWNALSAAGMLNPEIVIDSIFKSHSDDYHRTLLEKTQEILAKPVDVQNELAAAVSESNFVEVSTSSASEQDVESRLSGFGKVVGRETAVSTSSTAAPASHDRIKSVMAGLGRR